MTEFAELRQKLCWTNNFCIKMTGRMSSRTCYTKFIFDFPYVRSLSLRLDISILQM